VGAQTENIDPWLSPWHALEPGQRVHARGNNERRAKTVAVSTPLLERRRKISSKSIILGCHRLFSKHAYIRP
jgi:hypothetical protein